MFFRWTVADLVLRETKVLCGSPVFSQQHRVRNGSVPSQTSTSSGRWSEWQGVKVGSHQRTPLSDVARAHTALVCGRKAPQARCDSSNKVWDLRRDRCKWDEVKMAKVVFIFSPQNPQRVSTNSTCAIEDAAIKCSVCHRSFSGCWTHVSDHQSCRDDRCVVTNLPPQIQNGTYHFCCCGSDMCNVNFTEDFAQPSPTTAQPICKGAQAPFEWRLITALGWSTHSYVLPVA